MFVFLPALFLWNITGDTLTYHQNDQCATITGKPQADDTEKEYHLDAEKLKAKMCPAENQAGPAKQAASEVWADGSVHFTTKELDVRADHAYFHPTNNTVELEGNVVVKHKSNVAMGDSATIDLAKQTYTLHQAQGRVVDPKDLKANTLEKPDKSAEATSVSSEISSDFPQLNSVG